MKKRIAVPAAAAIRPAAARLAAVGGVLFVALFLALHLLKPDLDPSWRPISEYALGPFGWLMTVGFLVLAASCVLLFVAIASQVKTWPGRVGLAALLLAAIGFLVAGLFPTDPVTVAPEDMTVTGLIHSIGPVLADGIPLAAILVGWCLARRNPNWASARGWLLAGAILTVSAFLLVTVSLVVLLPPSGMLGPDVPTGWQGRFLVVAYAGWIVIVAIMALRVRRERGGTDAAASVGRARVDA